MKRILGLTGIALVSAAAGCGSNSNQPPIDASSDGTSDSTADGTSGSGETGTGSDAAQDTGSTDASPDQSTTDAAQGMDADAGAAAVPTPAPDYLWYVMDETSGAIAHDSSPHHYDITETGITWNQGGIFDGTTVCGSTNVGPQYRSPPITLSAWLTPAKRTDQPDTHALQPYPPNALSDDVPGVGGYGIGLNVWGSGSALAAEGVSPCTTAGLCVANGTQNAAAADAGDAGDGGVFSCTSASSCNQGFTAANEYFVTLTIDAPPDGGTMPTAQVYVNGVLFDQDSAYIPAANAAPPLYLGCHNQDNGYGTTRFFDGRIRDVRVYLRQVPAAEVKQLFVNGPTLHAPPRSDAGVSDAAAD